MIFFIAFMISASVSCHDDVPSPTSFNSSAYLADVTCFTSQSSIFILAACCIANLLVLPLFVYIIFLDDRSWWRRRSGGVAAAASLSDVFTYHSAIKQLVSMLAMLVFFYGGYVELDVALLVGNFVWTLAEDGQALIHVLTCVERYLAVVTPVTYRSLRQAMGTCVTNIIGGCVWLLSFLYVCVAHVVPDSVSTMMYMCCICCFLSIIGFCSISVLCTLRSPAPGEAGGKQGRMHHCKQRAFYTIMAILGSLLINFGGNTLARIVQYMLNQREICIELTSFWFSLPSSLVLPLLFLQKAPKSARRQNNQMD